MTSLEKKIINKPIENRSISMSTLANSKEVEYIQQNDEFDYLKSLIKSLDNGKSIGILLFGNPGTGKTLLSITLAKSLNSTYYFIDGSPDLDRRDLEGNWELRKGYTKFNYGPLTRAIKDANEKGICFIIINEINAIRESEQISLNSLLSENHINLISKGFERHELNQNAKLIIIGTMNKGVVGINKLQEAFGDRFLISPEITYPEKNKEIEIVKKVTDCKKGVAELVVDAAQQIRKQATEDFSISKLFSTRLAVNFCLLVSKMPPKYIEHNIQNCIVNKLAETIEEKKTIAMILDGKMFKEKLGRLLGASEDITKFIETAPSDEDKNNIIPKMKKAVETYIEIVGRDKIQNASGELMWKFLQWLWNRHRTVLREYFKLTEKMDYHREYKQKTGKDHIYGGLITLKYIKWIYQNKNYDIVIFMKRLYPIL
ncbi:MAG: Denitrification regulatory protein NirQ [Promethearchaeota archaeon]|nr:MAG: Denitrification regulatory protein NirQ [Candidatus Lokiarchaeota archaeon]